MKITLDHPSASYTLDLLPDGPGYTAVLGDQTLSARLLDTREGRLQILLNGRTLTAYVTADGPRRWVTLNGHTYLLTKPTGHPRRRTSPDLQSGLTAPMPGQIRLISVTEGQTVTKGQTLLVLEAMKMEIRIQSPRDGIVTTIHVAPGATVDREQLLIEVEEP